MSFRTSVIHAIRDVLNSTSRDLCNLSCHYFVKRSNENAKFWTWFQKPVLILSEMLSQLQICRLTVRVRVCFVCTAEFTKGRCWSVSKKTSQNDKALHITVVLNQIFDEFEEYFEVQAGCMVTKLLMTYGIFLFPYGEFWGNPLKVSNKCTSPNHGSRWFSFSPSQYS